MTAQAKKPRKKTAKLNTPVKIRKPRKGTKAEAILTLTATTPATVPQIAEAVNCTKQNVHQVLDRYGIEANNVEPFKANRADIFAGFQDKLLKSIDDEDIKKTPVGSRVLAACQIYDKERLERGQSTEHIMTVHADIAELKKLGKVEARDADDD